MPYIAYEDMPPDLSELLTKAKADLAACRVALEHIAVYCEAEPQTSAQAIMAKLAREALGLGTFPMNGVRKTCDWPAGEFGILNDPGEHYPCYVVMPGGAMLALNHHAGKGVDIARAEFIVDACNRALAFSSQGGKTAAPDNVGGASQP